MRLRHIEVFNAVMQTGSVSAAARLINVTQPAVSRTLQHAELQMGFALFQRARGRLTPTNEALALFPHIEKLFEQLDEVQRLAANLRHGQSADRLNVLTVFALSREVLPRAVAGFRCRHPQVQVHVQALHTPQVVSALLLQEADVGFVISSVGQPALEHELRQIRSIGMALEAGESHEGVACVAAPVFGRDRRITAGLSLTGPVDDIDPVTLGPAVRTAAFVLSRTLRSTPV